MIAEKLKKWAELLLDTGKRNNLINFRTTRMSTVEVVFPDYVTLFQRADQSAVFEVFDPKLEVDDYDAITVDTDSDEDESAPKTLSKEEFLSTYRDKMKKQQILAYNAANKPIAALKNISKKAKTELEERGVNIAYMTFGFINWTESDNAKIVMHAPILLTPIIIEQKSSIDPIKVRVIEDEMIVNPTFAYKLQSDYGIKLPEYADEGIESYLQRVKQLVAKLKWTVTTECEIGIFSFLKINMYKDLTDNGDKIVKNKNIRALLGDAEVRSGISEEYIDQGYDLLDLHNVVDADSSQADAIEMAKTGKDFVLQGPPGTGKSQTITNIIAECLSDGKKVLFVSEKLAALNVVYEKLKRVGLEEFCLELHSHKANKKAVIDELCRTLNYRRKAFQIVQKGS